MYDSDSLKSGQETQAMPEESLPDGLVLPEDPHAKVKLLKGELQQSADDWRLHNALGDALIAAGRPEEAIGALMAASRLNPRLSSACLKIGRIFLSRGLVQPAGTWLRMAVDGESEEAKNLAKPSLATVEARLGRREEAMALLESWVACDPEDPFRRHLAYGILGDDPPPKPVEGYVTSLFDGYADGFDESLKRLKYCGPELIVSSLREFASDRLSGWDVLDVGCGTGLVGQALRPMVSRIVGIDVSSNMVKKATERGVYDEVVNNEMVTVMQSRPEQFDALTAADVLTYLGDLSEFFAAAQITLRSGGLLVAALEAIEGATASADYGISPTGRFSHNEQYVRRCLTDSGFRIRRISADSMRQEQHKPVPTLVVVAQRKFESS